MFNKQFFEKYQGILLLLVNTFVGRYIFRIHGNRSNVGKNKIVKITPSAIFWLGGGKLTAEYRSHVKFSKRIYFTLLPVLYVFHAWDMLFANKFKPSWNLGFDTTGNLYPAAGSGTSPFDGDARRDGVNETFANITTGAGNFSQDTYTSIAVQLRSSTTTDQFDRCRRGIVGFDISGVSGTIDSAILSVYGQGKGNGLGSPSFGVCGMTPGSSSAVADADYGNFESTSFGGVSYASFSTAAYNDFTLNGDGETFVDGDKGGFVFFGLRLSWDLSASFTGTWASAAETSLSAWSVDQTGTSNDPKLVVTYTPASGFVSKVSIF